MTHSVVIYLTQSCPYCVRAKMLLDKKGVEYTEHRVDLNQALHDEMIQVSQQHTVPQIFIGDFHVGGFDDMHMMDLNGELDPLLFPDAEKGSD